MRKIGREVTRKGDGPTVAQRSRQRLRDSERSSGLLGYIVFDCRMAAGVMIFAAAKSAIHEIEAFLLFLIGAVFLVGAAVVEAIHSQRKWYAVLGNSVNPRLRSPSPQRSSRRRSSLRCAAIRRAVVAEPNAIIYFAFLVWDSVCPRHTAVAETAARPSQGRRSRNVMTMVALS